jgi:hypothetical protein
MFDLKSALAALNERELDFDRLQESLKRIRRQHLGDLSPEIGVRELLFLAQKEHWISEDENGNFHINVNRAA